MRSPQRRRHGFAVLGVWPAVLAGAGAAACATGGRTTHHADPGGWTDRPGVSTAGRPPQRERWDLADQVRTWHAATPRSRSEHLGGDLDAELLTSAAGGYPLHAPTQVAPVGATLVERLFDAGGTEPVVSFVMTKRAPGYDPGHGDWEYVVVARDGTIEERGKIGLCERCHAEAPHDHLFRGR